MGLLSVPKNPAHNPLPWVSEIVFLDSNLYLQPSYIFVNTFSLQANPFSF